MEGKPSQRSDQTPFTGVLKDAFDIGKGKLRQIENNPNKIIRKERFSSMLNRYHDKVKPFEQVRIAQDLYKELETKYKISVPVEFVIGKDEGGEDSVYSIVDKIDGRDLSSIEDKRSASEQVEILYTSIAKYFLDKSKEGGFYLTDINNPTQYIYGKKLGEEEDRIYLIDTDIYFHNKKIGLYVVVEWLTKHLIGIESLFQTKFDKARYYIEQFLNEPLPEIADKNEKEIVDKSLVEIKEFLNGEVIGWTDNPAIPIFFTELE